MSVEDRAAKAECSTESVYIARKGEKVSQDIAARLVRSLPDEAAVEYIARVLGFTRCVRTEAGAGSFHEVHYELTRTGAYYGEANRDGLLCHKEQRDLATKFLPRLMAAAARCMKPRASA